MVSAKTKSIIDRAKKLYTDELREKLEPQHVGEFVAIEPESGDYFLAGTFDSAVKAARTAHPTRISYTMRIGHRAAFHIGVMQL